MKYLIILLLLLILVIILIFKNKETFQDEIKSNLKCKDDYGSMTWRQRYDLLLNKRGEYLTLNQAIDRARLVNRVFQNEPYPGLVKVGNNYLLCKNVETTNGEGNVYELKNTLDGDIIMKGNVGVKTDPIPSFNINNEGTLLVKDKLCLQKNNRSYFCLTIDDIYRLKNLPITIPREKDLCLTTNDPNTGLESKTCVNKKQLEFLTGSAMANLRHMDSNKRNYGDGYVALENISNHYTHDKSRWYWYGFTKRNGRKGSFDPSNKHGDTLSFLTVSKNAGNKIKFGIIPHTIGRSLNNVGEQVLKSNRG